MTNLENLPPEFWNDPRYKPRTKLCDAAWDDFLYVSTILLEHHRRRNIEEPNKYPEPDIYDVFNWMRQEWYGELPFTQKRLVQLDNEIEKDFMRDSARRRFIQATK